MSEQSLTHGIKFKDKFGYALGDVGSLLTFSLVTAFQNKFYTDVLGISTAKIAVLILVARLWDAINDPLWGALIDSRKPTKLGKFRPYILIFSLPLAVASVLMFTKIPFFEGKYLLYAYITYIAYGMLYTCVNIPYGSMASVITDDNLERSSLSIWRSVGSGIGGLPSTILLPLLVYNTTVNADGTKIQTLDPNKLFYCVLIIALISVIAFFFHVKLSKERIVPSAKEQEKKFNVLTTIKDLAKNKPFVILCIVSLLLLAFQTYYQSTYMYLFSDYFHKAGLYSMVSICTYGPMLIFMPFMGKLVKKFGKKEICAVGIAFAAAVNILLFAMRSTSLSENPYVFLAFLFLSGAGQTFMVLEVWALVMDVIDYHELRTHRREEGTVYALFTFTRKLGQTLAGVGLNVLLGVIHYDGTLAGKGETLGQDVLTKLYDISTLVPALVLLIMALLLFLCYGLTKSKLEQIHTELVALRENN